MCIIMAKHKNHKFDKAKTDFAQKSNTDGYGVMWFDLTENKPKAYTTLDYNKFKEFLDTYNWFEETNAVIHLRYTTVGESTIDLCHPFKTTYGYVMHNGTIHDYKTTAEKNDLSDSAVLASTLAEIEATVGTSIYASTGFKSLFEKQLGAINRAVVMDEHGQIHIFNESLGEYVNEVWYSNDYYKNPRACPCAAPAKKSSSYGSYYSNYYGSYKDSYTDFTDLIADSRTCNYVFVYGTLKQNCSNHSVLQGASLVYDTAETAEKWAMINNSSKSFPYLIERNEDNGNHVQGEVYKISAYVLSKLDALEGYPYHYDREIVDITTVINGKQETVKAWVYHDSLQPYTADQCLKVWTPKRLAKV